MPSRHHAKLASFALSLSLLPAALFADSFADTIYSGGPILTMDDTALRAEAVAVRDGRILAVGSLSEMEQHRNSATDEVDLIGHTMIPGFIDSHGHVVFGGLQASAANLLAAPDGEVHDIASLLEVIQSWTEGNQEFVAQNSLIVGFGYDPSQLAEERHPTRDELDTVSTDVPVYIVHQSGHLGVANSAALAVFGLDADSENPPGGVIRRREGSAEPDGVLEGNAHFENLFKLIGGLGPEGMLGFARAGAEMWASYGFTTAQEGRSSPDTVVILNQLAEIGGLPIDVAVYPDVITTELSFITDNMSSEYNNRVRVAGGKLTIDGSPQGFTALRDKPYHDPVGDYPPGYSGLGYETPETIIELFDWAYKNGVQLMAHANGERASDYFIAAVDAATQKYGAGDRRPVLIHGQFMREDQVDSYNRLGVFPSLFPMHTFYWGDWHRDHTVGPVDADNISPTGWMRQRGMMFGTHHDAPVALPNSMRVLDATVTRRTRSGDILGPDQRVDVMTALKAMTIWPAYQHFEEDTKGSIEVGKLADFVILSDDPTAIDPEDLDSLKVLVTIKENEVIYSAIP